MIEPLQTAVCVFAYNRPKHLLAVLQALEKNNGVKHLPVRIYLDGPKDSANQEQHDQVFDVATKEWVFGESHVIKHSSNLGLYQSLTQGISETLNIYDSVIVIEDDILTSPYFIQYMLESLELYRLDSMVASIHGFTPPIDPSILPETFFLRGADCWGWATWRDRWTLFRSDADVMAQQIREQGLDEEFNLKGGYNYLAMLDERAKGSISSWAICWHASCFLANKFTLYPGRSLVRNIGLDGSGEHCTPDMKMESMIAAQPIRQHKIQVHIDANVVSLYCRHFQVSGHSKPGRMQAFKNIIKKAFRVIASGCGFMLTPFRKHS